MKELEITEHSNPMILKSFLLDDDPEAIDSMSIIANLRQGKIFGFKYRDEDGEKEHRLTHREWIQLRHLLNQLETRTAFNNWSSQEAHSVTFEPLVIMRQLFDKYEMLSNTSAAIIEGSVCDSLGRVQSELKVVIAKIKDEFYKEFGAL